MQLTIDEIIAMLERTRDHGPHPLQELVYQLALAVREVRREAQTGRRA